MYFNFGTTSCHHTHSLIKGGETQQNGRVACMPPNVSQRLNKDPIDVQQGVHYPTKAVVGHEPVMTQN